MPKDTQPKMPKTEQIKNLKTIKKDTKNKKNLVNDSSSDSSNHSSDEEDNEMDVQEYRKLLSDLFPSKYINKKVKAGEDLKKTIKKDLIKNSNKKSNKSSPKNKSKKNKKEDSSVDEDSSSNISEEENESSEYETMESEEENSEEENEKEIKDIAKKISKHFYVITSKIDAEDDEEEDEDEDEDYNSEDYDSNGEYIYSDTEDEDVPVSSSESEDESENNIITRSKNKNNKTKNNTPTNSPKNKIKDAKIAPNENEEKCETELIDILKNLLEKSGNNEIIQNCLDICEENKIKSQKKTERKIQKTKDKHGRIFKKMLKDKNIMNDFDFFKNLEPENQRKIIKELREINKVVRIEKPYRLTLLEAPIPVNFKGAAMKKITSLKHMDPGSGEYYKMKNWLDTFMRIPFGKYEKLPIDYSDGVDKCHEFMENALKTLDSAIYGLNDAKIQIMQMLGQLITNPSAMGTAIALHGPMGTGKTTLVKEGISKILNRPFAFIALGGATDSSFLEGHSYTYEGSIWGKIVQILIDSKCMNPVIYFDELDKISDTPKGEEITGILTHLTDTSQNSQFHDKYFSEIDFDLSKCLFIFSYNDVNKVNPILRDRMYKIQTKGYDKKQKTIISNQYILPKIMEQVKFEEGQIIIPQETIHHIIDNFCEKEDGVRNLKRCLEIIYTKLNLYRLMKPGSNLFEQDMSMEVTFPFNVTKQIVDKLIKKESDGLETWKNMFI